MRIPFGGGFNNDEDLLRLRLLVHGDTVSLLVAHFASHRLSPFDYTSPRGKVKGVIRKMIGSFPLRATQADILAREINQTEGP